MNISVLCFVRFHQRNEKRLKRKDRTMLRAFIIVLLVVSAIHCADQASGNVRASTASSKTQDTTKRTQGTSATDTRPTATGPTGTVTRPTTRPTTTSPYLTCYVCGGGSAPCPDPFPSNGRGVQTYSTLRPAFCAVSTDRLSKRCIDPFIV